MSTIDCEGEEKKAEVHCCFQDRSLTEDEKKARKKADRERKRQEARDAAEKKKRFGLTPEKKRKLRVRSTRKPQLTTISPKFFSLLAFDHENGYGQS